MEQKKTYIQIYFKTHIQIYFKTYIQIYFKTYIQIYFSSLRRHLVHSKFERSPSWSSLLLSKTNLTTRILIKRDSLCQFSPIHVPLAIRRNVQVCQHSISTPESPKCKYHSVCVKQCKHILHNYLLTSQRPSFCFLQAKHRVNDCYKRLVACRYCSKSYVAETLVTHQTKCARAPIPCPNQCEMVALPREELDVHIKEHCNSLLVSCVFKEAGCRFKVSSFSKKSFFLFHHFPFRNL